MDDVTRWGWNVLGPLGELISQGEPLALAASCLG